VEKSSFDFIVVGGGSAGCLLANRLSENPQNKVCLVEAGASDRNFWVRNCNPINMLYLMGSKKYNWMYHTRPETRTGNRPFFWPRGRGLGGSSSINAMIYTRGHPWDYNHWAELGNEGWDYQSVLPAFMKSERQSRGADAYHGDTGTMDVSDTTFHFPVSDAFLAACAQTGFPRNDDMNGATQEGCGYFQVTQTESGGRCNSGAAFLDDVMHRDNLSVLTNTHVGRVLFEGKTAVGVECYEGGNRSRAFTLRATKEVVLSAGVISSPHLLKLSGVGPAEELGKFGIPLVHDLPGVGENLQDHPDILLRCRDKSNTCLGAIPNKQFFKFIRAMFSRKKPFRFTPTDCGGFIKSDPGLDIPDLQLQFAAMRMKPHGKDMSMSLRSGYVLHICHLRPKSRGRVVLESADPMAAPGIEANYFAEDEELEALVKGVKIGREILRQTSLEPFHKLEEAPGGAVQSDEQIRQFLRDKVETVYHTAGSCKMGNDSLAVVDSKLRVHGIENLRVIDSSIMPTITGSNIHGPPVMIAERGAQMLCSAAT
jgi:choline dehydrogenase-like flavoprotein